MFVPLDAYKLRFNEVRFYSGPFKRAADNAVTSWRANETRIQKVAAIQRKQRWQGPAGGGVDGSGDHGSGKCVHPSFRNEVPRGRFVGARSVIFRLGQQWFLGHRHVRWHECHSGVERCGGVDLIPMVISAVSCDDISPLRTDARWRICVIALH